MQCAIYILNFGQMKNEIYKGTNGVRSPTKGIFQMKNDFGQMAKHKWQMKHDCLAFHTSPSKKQSKPLLPTRGQTPAPRYDLWLNCLTWYHLNHCWSPPTHLMRPMLWLGHQSLH